MKYKKKKDEVKVTDIDIKLKNIYITENNCKINASFVSFDNANIPQKNNSVDVITSFLGIGSTRANGEDETNCLNKLYRVYKNSMLLKLEN